MQTIQRSVRFDRSRSLMNELGNLAAAIELPQEAEETKVRTPNPDLQTLLVLLLMRSSLTASLPSEAPAHAKTIE